MIERAALNAAMVLAILAAVFAAGWNVKGWKDKAEALTAERERTAAVVGAMNQHSAQAAATIAALQDQKAGQTIIRREVIREVEKYRDRPCLGDDAVRLLNLSATGSAPDGADGGMPADAAGTP